MITATVAETGYSDGPYLRQHGGDPLPMGKGRQGGARARLIVIGREAEWAKCIIQQAPKGLPINLRVVVPAAGDRYAICVPVARSAAELVAEIEAADAAATAEIADRPARWVRDGYSVISALWATQMGAAVEVEPGHWLTEDGREFVTPEVTDAVAREIGVMVDAVGQEYAAAQAAKKLAATEVHG